MDYTMSEQIFYILLALLKENHGYGIMQDINEITNKRMNIGPGTLYGALKNLEKRKLIKEISDSNGTRKKNYIITDLGREVFENEIKRMKELVNHGELTLKGDL